MSSPFQWVRPTDMVSYPHVWAEFSEKEQKSSDKVAKYWIQDLPESRFDEALDRMTKCFICDEPMSEAVGRLTIVAGSGEPPRKLIAFVFR